jgi:serralysin
MAISKTIVGTPSDDRLVGRGNGEFIDGRDGRDTLVMAPSGANGAPGRWIIDLDRGAAYSPPLPGVFSPQGYGLTFKNIENAEGTGFIDQIWGTAGPNVLMGFWGDDSIDGRAGNDIIVGGAGADTLIGGSGADLFRWLDVSESRKGSGIDTIFDFQQGDLLDVSTIDANVRVAGNQAFTFIDTQTFHKVAGELRLYGGGFQADVNGDGVADMEARFTNGYALHSWDFIL